MSSRPNDAQTLKIFCYLLIAVATLLSGVSAAAQEQLPELRDLDKSAEVSALVVRLDDVQTVASIHPDKRLTPASTSKLFTSAAALKQFGPSHRFTTQLTTRAQVRDGVIHGDLRLIGGGDPALDTQDLRHLAQRLAARGIQHISGDLVIDTGQFGHVTCATRDRCDAQTLSGHAYDAPLSAAGINFGTLHATIYPGHTPNESPRVVLHPVGLTGYRIDNQSRTAHTDSRPGLRVWRSTDDQQSVLHIRGQLPANGKPIEIHRSIANAGRETAHAMSRILDDAGIVVEGGGRVDPQSRQGHKSRHADTNSTTALAQIKSRTLAEQIIPMMAYSNNYMADTLILDTAAAQGQNPPISLANASASLEQLGRQARLAVYGPDAAQSAPRFATGSGLGVKNQASARDIVALLASMYRNSALFPAFYASLPVPRFSPHQLLKKSNQAFRNRLTAKTGTLSEPVSVRALAGYIRTDDNGFAAYAIIINGTQNNPHPPLGNTVGAYKSDLERLLTRN